MNYGMNITREFGLSTTVQNEQMVYLKQKQIELLPSKNKKGCL